MPGQYPGCEPAGGTADAFLAGVPTLCVWHIYCGETEPALSPQSHTTVLLRKELLRAWLLLLVHLEPGYGYELRVRLVARGFRADPTSVYRILRELEEQGLLDSRWDEAGQGPRRRVYRLNRKGRRELEHTAIAFAGARNAQSAFLRVYKKQAAPAPVAAPAPA